MEYQKINKLVTPNQPFKLWTRNWVEISIDSCWTHNNSSQIKFRTSMLKLMLCDYSDAYIHVIGTITIPTLEQQQAQVIETNIWKLCSIYWL